MESEDRKTIFTRRNILLLIALIILIIILLIGCSQLKNRNDVPDVPGIIDVTSITVDVSNLSLKVGETKKINATIYPANATNQTLSYSTDNDSVATVDSEGNVTGVGEGTATITVATNNGITTTVNVIVEKDETVEVSKPTIKFGSPSGTKGQNNWYISNVTVKVTATDADTIKYCKSSGIKCTPKTTIKSGQKITLGEGIWRIYVTATNSAGSTTSKTELIRVDVTKPTITFAGTGDPAGVKIVATCNDGTSGIAKCAESDSTPATINGVQTNATYSVTDNAGNTNSGQVAVTSRTEYRSASCATGFGEWKKGAMTCTKTIETYNSQVAINKEYAESNKRTYYYSCGYAIDCEYKYGVGESCIKYTRSCYPTNCGAYGEWTTTAIKGNCSRKVETRTMYVMN